MSAYMLGNLLGRFLLSYALVLLLCWLYARLNVRRAWRLSWRWYNVLAALALTLLGLGAAFSAAGGLR